MVKHTKSLKGCMQNETLYGSGGSLGSVSRQDAPLGAGEGSGTGLDKVISSELAVPLQNIQSEDAVNSDILGTEDFVEDVTGETSKLTMFFQTLNFYNKIMNGTIGVVDSFVYHNEDDYGPVDLVGSFATEWSLEITKKPMRQTFSFKSRKAVGSVALSSVPAESTADKMKRGNLTVFTVDSVLLASLEVTERIVITVSNEWDETKDVLNEFYMFESTMKHRKIRIEFDHLAPNNATYTNTWESKLASSTIHTATIAITIGSLFTKSLSNMKLVSHTSRSLTEKGKIKYTTAWESTPTTVIS